ncbi:SRPBCC family protein [Actinophytocola sp. NPDC049390]|uniref:SRPBCC family protein n=1 Tax=Actinophytocola sp. NPDC049390 TaxID=3363894 RepID=UPI0037B7BB5E
MMAVQVRRVVGRTRGATVVEERAVPLPPVVGAAALAAGVGAAVEYVLDPDRGRARRAKVRDKAVHASSVIDNGCRVLARDMAGRGRGMVAGARYLVAGRRVEDDVLHERVRAELGRHVSHPHAVHVHVTEGVVTLTGDVLAAEDQRARRALRRVPGVRRLAGDWTAHTDTTGVSALQGNGRARVPTMELMQEQWSPTARFLMGTAAVGSWLVSRRAPAPVAWALRGAGTAVAARVATNLPMRRITGLGAGRRAVRLHAAVCVPASPGRVWSVVSDYSVFPMFMPDVRLVNRSEDGRMSRWEISGPGGLPIRFDAEETEREEGRRISWQTREGELVAHSGTMRLDPLDDGRTRVQVELTYNPVAGAIGHAVAALLGANPARKLHDDLQRLRTALDLQSVGS